MKKTLLFLTACAAVLILGLLLQAAIGAASSPLYQSPWGIWSPHQTPPASGAP